MVGVIFVKIVNNYSLLLAKKLSRKNKTTLPLLEILCDLSSILNYPKTLSNDLPQLFFKKNNWNKWLKQRSKFK